MGKEQPFHKDDRPIPEYLRDVMNSVASAIERGIRDATTNYDRHVGFILFCFDFGPDGHMSYISNAERESALDALAEYLTRNGRTVAPKGG